MLKRAQELRHQTDQGTDDWFSAEGETGCKSHSSCLGKGKSDKDPKGSLREKSLGSFVVNRNNMASR